MSENQTQQEQQNQQQLQTQQQAQQQQQQQQHARDQMVTIGNQPVHLVLQGNTAQVIKYEINIPQESGQAIEWGQEAMLRIQNSDGSEELKKVLILKWV